MYDGRTRYEGDASMVVRTIRDPVTVVNAKHFIIEQRPYIVTVSELVTINTSIAQPHRKL